MNTCRFTFVQKNTALPVTAFGVEQSWEQLQAEFDRQESGFPGATYFKTISLKGPQLFAVVNNEWVLYHDAGQWHRYISATDIKLGRMNTMLDELERATTEEESQSYFDKAFQEEIYGIQDEN